MFDDLKRLCKKAASTIRGFFNFSDEYDLKALALDFFEASDRKQRYYQPDITDIGFFSKLDRSSQICLLSLM